MPRVSVPPDYRLNFPEIGNYFIPPVTKPVADLNESFLDPVLVNVGTLSKYAARGTCERTAR